MKKLKLDFQQLGNAEVLTRSQLKKIMGGDGGSGGSDGFPCSTNGCSLSIQGSDGTWITRYGNCANNPNHLGCYCDVGLGVIEVTSNGGVSRCRFGW